ncbi:hypothetical protein GOPIP_104_00100 [Gordonia polyisoprenivorans NBRC 16320 = JCM 10675]|uniref:Secreted protein n=1 Tax=Gordonia polyisoprenivorans TaxID=84595 RepID=A0A846WUU8_9ACTN|nr:hypothetical protein [Gordonia polyisoprenivorans]NKY04847.1 hypothetical protein [Gordonia polyisoprenivorans]OZC30826.1 hypothetical protein CJJ17_04660 [Gordonia polyisoprenivorans]GAB26470.1 hypothetical protein GOPIP_104_00100 [Gordonia polyisoprenivorans NBRC 16320 = JCM 10675]
MKRSAVAATLAALAAATTIATTAPATASTSIEVKYVFYTNTTSVDYHYTTPTDSFTRTNRKFLQKTEKGNYYLTRTYRTTDEYDIPSSWISTNFESDGSYVQCNIYVDGHLTDLHRGYGPYASAYC